MVDAADMGQRLTADSQRLAGEPFTKYTEQPSTSRQP